MDEKIEKMDEFFTNRLDLYEDHMLRNAEGVAEGYRQLVPYLPAGCRTLLDLGCGTGLELEEVFKACPNLSVTGIDMTQAMLDRLQSRYGDRSVRLICGNYLTVDFGIEVYDAALSFETLHHLTPQQKGAFYPRILRSLKPGGRYIEVDYMVLTQQEEDFGFSESTRMRAEQRIAHDEIVHIDTPCTVDNQIELLRRAGFRDVKAVWRQGATTLIIADRS